MKCYKCKAPVPDDVEICPHCGASQGFSPEKIQRAKENDQNAIAELYSKTYSNVYYTIKALIKDEDAALDILQDSYLKAFRSLDQLQDPSKFRAWIKRIAHNRAVDYLRQTKAVNFSDISTDDTDLPLEFEDTNPENLPEVVIDQKETARLMAEILDSLPSDQRACVSMFYYEQMSVKEIAEELGVSENTVKSRLNYGRKKVETQVRELEKKGARLYGLAPIPFLLLLFRSQEAYAAEIPASSVLQGASAFAVQETGTSAGAAANTAATTAGKTAAKAAGTAVRTKLIAGAAAVAVATGGGAAAYHHFADQPPAMVQEEQILPQAFLEDMEVLAENKLSTVLSDNDWLEFQLDDGEVDITPEYIRIDNTQLSKDAIFFETGGTAALYLVFEGDVHISDDWGGMWMNRIANDYPDAAIVFKLDSFPEKFLREDGSIVYDKDDLSVYRIFLSREAFDEAIRQEYRYVTHDYYDIDLP